MAVSLPDEIKGRIYDAQKEVAEMLPGQGIRWTRQEQFHLTLRFLGDVEAARTEALAEALRGACRGFSPLRLRAEGIGCFPDFRRPRVLWTGVWDATQQLPRLHEAVAGASRGFTSEEKEERFTGHITLARFKGINRATAEALAQAATRIKKRCFGDWTACHIELMQSELLPEGARHTTMAAVGLSEGHSAGPT